MKTTLKLVLLLVMMTTGAKLWAQQITYTCSPSGEVTYAITSFSSAHALQESPFLSVGFLHRFITE